MTFSTRSNPRIGQSTSALTSLGAVGGPRGVGAGALRILVEFVSTYSKEAADQLQKDLASIERAQNISDAAQTRRLQKLAQVRGRIAQSDALIRGKLNTQQRAELKTVEALENLRTKAGKSEAAAVRTRLNATLQATGLSKDEIALIQNRLSLRDRENQLVKQQEGAETRAIQRARQRGQVEAQLQKVQQGRATLGQRLGGLAVGAIGGLIGGAVIGVGFQAVQGVLDAIGEKLQDIIDPARHAREAIIEVGGAIAKLAEQDNLSLRAATVKYLHDLGIEADAATTQLLENAAAQKLVADAIAARKQVADIAQHGDAQEIENRKQLRDTILEEARARGDDIKNLNTYGKGPQQLVINGVKLEDLVTQQLNQTLSNLARNSMEAAAAQAALANAAALAAVQQRVLQGAINDAFSVQGAALEGTGESQRTRNLQKRIEAIQNRGSGDGGAARRDQLRRIAEERELIYLRQRLRLLGANINLEKYSGKFLLEAINAKIAALQKQGDEQDRLNSLLDLQYRASQAIRRQAGESINDFVERRAQEQRQQLAEGARLEREAKIASLEQLRDKVQDEVALVELAEQRKQALRTTGANKELQALQKALEASRKADAKALKDKQEALQKQQASVLFYTDKTNQEQIRRAADAAKTIQDIYALSGELQGLESARTFLQALLSSGVLTPGQAAAIKDALRSLTSTINHVQLQFAGIIGGPVARNQTLKEQQAEAKGYGYAKGGIVQLSNARSPFGQNVRTGEEGSEIGVILSNKVAGILKQQTGAGVQFGDVNFYGDSDWRYSMYQFKQTIKDVIREELRD